MQSVEILKETKDYVVVNKPAGMLTHADGHSKEETVASWLLGKYPEIKGVGEPILLSSGEVEKKYGIVHRLDKGTSGVLVVAKSQSFFEWMKQEFKARRVEKTYHALVYGALKEKRGVIDRPIARSRSNFKQWSAQRGARGQLRSAVTSYAVLEEGKKFSFLELNPKTGRTHQIRVHLKAVNHPIVGDSLYAPNHADSLGLSRIALHSWKISFLLPTGEKVGIEAPYPQDFKEALKNFRALPGTRAI